MLSVFASVVVLSLFAVVGYDFFSEYQKSTLTGWPRVWAAWSGGAADIKHQLGLVAAGLVAFSGKIADWVGSMTNDPSAADSVKSIISAYVTPATIGVAMAAFTLLTVALKLRKD